MTREDLNPCPFCGGEAAWEDIPAGEDIENAGASYITCTRCWACTRLEFGRKENLASSWNSRATAGELQALIDENERLREANGILEDALQEVGDDYPGSSCQEWCQQQVKAARAALSPNPD